MLVPSTIAFSMPHGENLFNFASFLISFALAESFGSFLVQLAEAPIGRCGS